MFQRFHTVACAVSHRTVTIFADARLVVLFVALSIASPSSPLLHATRWR